MHDHTADLDAYAAAFEALTPQNLAIQLEPLFAEQAYFEDPFNQVYGWEAIEAIFEHMFHIVHHPKFDVLTRALSGDTAFLEWQFTFFDRQYQGHKIYGTSKVVFDAQGRVLSHVDYWDTGLYIYQKVPVLGAIIRWINRKLRPAT